MEGGKFEKKKEFKTLESFKNMKDISKRSYLKR